MASTILENTMFKDMFGAEEMRRVFSEENTLHFYVQVEVALAAAQGRIGLIPAEAAAAIAREAPSLRLDLEQLKRDTENVGYPIVGLVRQLAAHVGDAGRFVHWGATTQDIMDTGLVLQLRDAIDLIARDVAAVTQGLTALARQHRDTPMAGRTHLQQALPITFGYKAAVWLSMLQRHAERLEQITPRVLVAQLGGAAGTLASMGDKGLDVQRDFALQLGLPPPVITWHVARDSLAELVQFLGLIAGTLGKIGFDVMLLMATEIAEVSEPFASHRGSSSTMPQKRNPIASEILVANAKGVRQHCGLMLDAMVQDFERASGPWHVEWIALPESFILTAGALQQAKFILQDLVVDAERMRQNLDLTGGLIVAEAVMMGLAPHMGRQAAHDAVYNACRTAIDSRRALYDVLRDLPSIRDALPDERLRALCDPANYLGSAAAMVDQVLATSRDRTA